MTDKIKVEFAPGAFDSFEGTQEELDELIKMIQDKAEDGSLFEESRPIDIEELVENMTDEQLEALAAQFGISEEDIEEIGLTSIKSDPRLMQ
jgi:nitrogen regulatory protein PII-like uncharacterized protein